MHKGECNGAYSYGGEKKQDKKSPNWASRTCFQSHDHVQKTSVLAGMVEGAREDKGRELCGM